MKFDHFVQDFNIGYQEGESVISFTQENNIDNWFEIITPVNKADHRVIQATKSCERLKTWITTYTDDTALEEFIKFNVLKCFPAEE